MRQLNDMSEHLIETAAHQMVVPIGIPAKKTMSRIRSGVVKIQST
jgi:hypothetical protein